MFASYHHSASRLFHNNHTNPFKHTNMLLSHQHSTSRHVHTNHTTPSTHQPASTAPIFYMLDVPDIATGLGTVCCSVLQCVAVCCSVLQCVAVCCSQGITYDGLFDNRRRIVSQCVAVCCSVLQCVAARASHTMVYLITGGAVCRSVLLCVAMCCFVLWCAAVVTSHAMVYSTTGRGRWATLGDCTFPFRLSCIELRACVRECTCVHKLVCA